MIINYEDNALSFVKVLILVVEIPFIWKKGWFIYI